MDWIKWVFSGIGVAVIGWLFFTFKKRDIKIKSERDTVINGSGDININNN